VNDAATRWPSVDSWLSLKPVPVGPDDMHVQHCYFNMDPRHPVDGRVLVFLSKEADSQRGDIALVGPEPGRVDVLAAGLEVEDAHRQATQHFVADGRWVVFNNRVGDEWRGEAVDTTTKERRVVARDCQVGFGHSALDLLVLVPLAWRPRPDGDLRLVRVSDGSLIRTVKLETVVKQVGKRLPAPPLTPGQGSLFAPLMSPDGQRLIMKLNRPTGGGARDARGSERWGMVGYDLREDRVLFAREEWGHPAWHPDSRRILCVERAGYVVIDSDTGNAAPLSYIPRPWGSHPSWHPDGRTIVTDLSTGDQPYEFFMAMAQLDQPGLRTLFSCGLLKHATTSWRQAHVHPVFDRAGRRLYFNMMGEKWVRLHCLTAE
jgi:hypothetical protein